MDAHRSIITAPHWQRKWMILLLAPAGAYKPRMRAFEYMLGRLVCASEDILHCSSSYRYDLMTAYDMRFGHRAFVNRGHEPANPYYGAHEVKNLGELPALLGL